MPPDPAPKKKPVTIDVQVDVESVNKGRPPVAEYASWERPTPEPAPEETAKKPPSRLAAMKNRAREARVRLMGREAWMPLLRWAMAAAILWGAAYIVVETDLSAFNRQRDLAQTLRDFAKPDEALRADLPWLRLPGKEAADWNLYRWESALRHLQQESRALRTLGTARPDQARYLVPDWEALEEGRELQFKGDLATNRLTEDYLKSHFQLMADAVAELERRTKERAPAAAAAQSAPAEPELRAFYEAHLPLFEVPEVFQVRHVFLAAHPGTPAEKVEAAGQLAEDLARRLQARETTVEALAPKYSEDEATKKIGGLLPRFTESRVPADFLTAVKAAPLGEPVGPVRTKIGYHLLVVESRIPARRVGFEEARPRILAAFRQAVLDRERDHVLAEAGR
jgi:hypothetical protein